MEPGSVKKIYQKFLNPIQLRKKTGHGIGMMIVHRIMRDHGGDIGIDSKTGSGTIVTLRFPRSTVWKNY